MPEETKIKNIKSRRLFASMLRKSAALPSPVG
jgi:hypothetical protein